MNRSSPTQNRGALFLVFLLALALMLSGLVDESKAQGPFTWRIGQISATSYVAGTNSDITMVLEANNDTNEQDLESMRLAWPDGLMPMSNSSGYCELAINGSNEYYCSNPGAQKIGSQTLDAVVSLPPPFGDQPVTVVSSSYAEEPQPGEAARSVSIPDDNPTQVSYSSAYVRGDGSGIDMVSTGMLKEIAVPPLFPSPQPLHIHRLQTTINGTTSGAITIPAICDPVSFNTTFTSYGDDGVAGSGDEQVRTDTEPFSITDCQAIPYSPTVNLSLTSSIAGATSNLVTSTDSNATDALTKDMYITLPAGFGMAPTGVSACSSAEVAAASCQSSSQLGTVSVSSILSPTPMQGTIHQTEPQGDAVGIAIFLTASFGNIQLSGTLMQTAEGGVEMAFTDYPPLGGMGSVEINMNSASGGSLQNPWTCGTYNATSTYKSHNLRQVSGTHPLNIVGCQTQEIDTDLTVKLWKQRNNRYTDMRLKVTQSPRQVVDRATFYLPKSLKFKYRGQSKKKPLAYVEFWDGEKVKRAKLFKYTTKRKRKSKTRPLKLKAKNRQLKRLRVTVSKKKKYTKVSVRNIPKDKPLSDFSVRLFGKRTRLIRTFKKCVKHRGLEFSVKVDSESSEAREASNKQRVKCLRKKVSKKHRGSNKKLAK